MGATLLRQRIHRTRRNLDFDARHLQLANTLVSLHSSLHIFFLQMEHPCYLKRSNFLSPLTVSSLSKLEIYDIRIETTKIFCDEISPTNISKRGNITLKRPQKTLTHFPILSSHSQLKVTQMTF